MSKQSDTVAVAEVGEVAPESGTRALQALRHSLLERGRRFGRHALSHHSEASRGKRKEQRRLDHVPVSERENVVDGHIAVAFQAGDQLAEEVVDVAFVDREQQFFLAREIEIHRPFGETCFVGDFGHVRHAVLGAQQKSLCCVQNGVVPLLLGFGLDGALPYDHVRCPPDADPLNDRGSIEGQRK